MLKKEKKECLTNTMENYGGFMQRTLIFASHLGKCTLYFIKMRIQRLENPGLFFWKYHFFLPHTKFYGCFNMYSSCTFHQLVAQTKLPETGVIIIFFLMTKLVLFARSPWYGTSEKILTGAVFSQYLRSSEVWTFPVLLRGPWSHPSWQACCCVAL